MYPYPASPDEWEALSHVLMDEYPEDIVQDTLLHLLEKSFRNEPLRTGSLNWCRMDASGDIKMLRYQTRRHRELLQDMLCEGHIRPTQEVRAELSMVAAGEGRTLRQVARANRIKNAKLSPPPNANSDDSKSGP